jgi:peroxiredoxin
MKSTRFILLFTILSFNLTLAQEPEKAEDICPLLVGESFPNATLKDERGRPVDLLSTVYEKPSVIIFYRGSWCPHCVKHLSAVATVEQEIMRLGFQILAISVDDPLNLEPMASETSGSYTLLSDPEGKLTTKMGLAFSPNAKTKDLMAKKSKGTVAEVLPVPSLFIVDTKGVILFEHISPNYKERIAEKMLLAVLKSL